MAVRINLECGHTSMLRERTTPEGYTHDWEVFVRGENNADIQQYIDKVVFQLHETFPRPKRVLREPPYIVKESGYAGFVIPIYVHLKNKDEPKRFQINYDLVLQHGPAINNVIRHTQTFFNPSDDFRRKLLKGGAVVVSNAIGASDKGESKNTTLMVGKPKLSGSEVKKHRLPESRPSSSFTDLFGTPIKTVKGSPDNKKALSTDKTTSNLKPPGVNEKSDKLEKILKTKHSPHKDGRKEKVSGEEKKEKKDKDHAKDKDRNKDKLKRPPSPENKSSHLSPGIKRTSSPLPIKKPASPIPQPLKRPSSPRAKEKEAKKPLIDKERDKDKEKIKDTSKTLTDSLKSERKKDKKKHKEDRDKERKEKHKDRDREKSKEAAKNSEKKPEKLEKFEKVDKEKNQEPKPMKEGRKSPKPSKIVEKVADDKQVKEKVDKSDKIDKTKEAKSDKDRPKHKHKKRDKKDRRDGSKEHEKKEKRDKVKSSSEKQNNLSAQSANSLATLATEIVDRDSSDSAPSPDDDSLSESKPLATFRKDPGATSIPSTEMARPPSPPPPLEVKKERGERTKKDKSKAGRAEERERKRKRRSDSKGDEEPIIKREKDRGRSTSPPLEPVSSSQSPVAIDAESVHPTKDKEDRTESSEVIKTEGDAEQVAPDSTNNAIPESEMSEAPLVFSEDYVSQLKDLQQKIMTLQDNQELQRVVQVIAETGQYEITKKTFDFDLCTLDRRTVQRLQQFFSAS
ncbi:protein AF-9 [Cephus cinctus]|uniref:Protein AF-9 n=1 Tax=Cephus cinctus TaxID=211228 RepID=A0AAJ7BHP7_CEPCN|nr:protein AF-9 [Cephus cinctus]XP_024936218.1 protein AF-9 [Cephus cinctus]